MKLTPESAYKHSWRTLCVIQFGILLVIYTYLGLTPAPEKDVPIIVNDLFMHFAGYCVASVSITLLAPHWRASLAALLLILYSIGIEIAQHFNPPRTFSWADILANAAGVLTGLLVITQLRRHFAVIDTLVSSGRITPVGDSRE